MTKHKQERININPETNNSNMIKIISTLNIALLAECFAGICRFSFVKGQILPPTWMKKIYGACLIALNIGLYALVLYSQAAKKIFSIVDVLDELPMIVIMIQCLVTLVTTNFLCNKANKEIFIKLAELDSQLITANSDEFYEKAKEKNIRFVILLGLAHIVVSVSDLATNDSINTGELIYLPLYLLQKIEIAMFCSLIEILKSRLDIINGYIAKFLDVKDGDRITVFTVRETKEKVKESSNFIGRPSENNKKIRDLATMFDTIGTLCSLVNHVFNFQIFMTLVSTFTCIIVTIWTTLYYYRTPESSSSGQLFTIVVWCFTTLMTVALTCFVCERQRLSRIKTKILVNEIIMNYDLPKTMRVQAKAFMELIEEWPLSILIYDMFSVDITLMLKFISVSTTYLIVIIQVSHFA